jgi:nicotinamidase-related amidase
MGKTALILVDIQRDYFPGGGYPLPGMEVAAVRAAKVLEHFRISGLPLWHIRHVELDPEGDFFLPDTEGAEFHGDVAPIAGEKVITKHFANAFRDTALEKELRAAHVSRIVFAGAMSNMCIDASVRAAWDLGFECIVIHDACAASDLEFNDKSVTAPEVQAAFMGALASAYASVVSSADLKQTVAV